MKFKEITTVLQKLGYTSTNFHSIMIEGVYHTVDIDDEEYHNIEMLLMKDWIRKAMSLDITINAYDAVDDDSGGQFNIYTSQINIIQKNGKSRWQIDYDDNDYHFSYYECLQHAIGVALEYHKAKEEVSQK
jgi:hypothetical protein